MMFKFNFNMPFLQNIFLLMLLKVFINNAKGYLVIHESSVWIPLYNNEIESPFYLYHPNLTFYPTIYSVIPLNTNANQSTLPPIHQHSFIRSYLKFTSSGSTHPAFISDYQHLNMGIVLENSTVNSIPVTGNVNIHRKLTPLVHINDTVFMINEISIQQGGVFDLIIAEDQNERILASQIDPSVSFHKTLLSFIYGNKTYYFGSQFVNSSVVYFLSELTQIQNEISSFVYKERFMLGFNQLYGSIEMVQFATSENDLNYGDAVFSKLIFISYAKNNANWLMIISFDTFINLFNAMHSESCETLNSLLWYRVDLEVDEWRCSVTTRERISNIDPHGAATTFYLQNVDIAGFILENLMTENWSQIVDFVPLSFASTKGYLLLLLSSDENYNQYRFSIHHIVSFSQVVGDVYSKIIPVSGAPISETTKIYYYNLPVPRVLVSLNQFHYTEVLVLCSIIQKSCLDCLSVPYYGDDTFFKGYCTWTPGSDGSGTCSASEISPESITFGSFNYTKNTCFQFTMIMTTYDPNSLIFNIAFEISGYDADHVSLYPLQINLLENSMSEIQKCSSQSIEYPRITIECVSVYPGFYRLMLVIDRATSPSVYSNMSSLVTLSQVFPTENQNILIDNIPTTDNNESSWVVFIFLFLVLAMVIACLFVALGASDQTKSRILSCFDTGVSLRKSSILNQHGSATEGKTSSNTTSSGVIKMNAEQSKSKSKTVSLRGLKSASTISFRGIFSKLHTRSSELDRFPSSRRKKSPRDKKKTTPNKKKISSISKTKLDTKKSQIKPLVNKSSNKLFKK